tara:strand:+ start:299 stop:943 length:645 start_codon:yes stop_codon:yes gene_type:complete
MALYIVHCRRDGGTAAEISTARNGFGVEGGEGTGSVEANKAAAKKFGTRELAFARTALSMGLEADFTIHVHWGEKEPNTEHDGANVFDHPMKDGWPIYEHQLHVLRLHNHHRIHAWICKHVSQLANECQEVDVNVAQLKELEHTLKKFTRDSRALPACPTDERSEEQLKTDMEGARQIAKKIRKMWKYIEKETKKWLNDEGYEPIVHGYYWAMW